MQSEMKNAPLIIMSGLHSKGKKKIPSFILKITVPKTTIQHIKPENYQSLLLINTSCFGTNTFQ